MLSYLHQWHRNRKGNKVLPLELIFFVTARCNFHCRHCFLQKTVAAPGREVSLADVRRLSDDLPNLMVLMLTGGEPFLRSDLADIVDIFGRQSKPRIVSIATNGFLTAQILTAMENILERWDSKIHLILTLSFEGTPAHHNRNRNCLNAYQRAMETAREIVKLKRRFKRFSIGANLTLIPENEAEVIDAARTLSRDGLFDFLSHNIYRQNRPRFARPGVSLTSYQVLSNIVLHYSRRFRMDDNPIIHGLHRSKENYQANIISRTCRQQRYQGIPCEAGRGIGVVYADGAVSPCELWDDAWGNIMKNRFSSIWNQPINRRIADNLRATGCFCTHECFLSASMNLQPHLYPRLMTRWLANVEAA